MTRLFDAPRHLVFEAMTKPEHVRRWWGCSATATRCRSARSIFASAAVALREPAPEGRGRVPRRVSRDRAAGRVVFTEIFEDFPDVESVVTAELTDEAGKTRLTATVRYPSKDVRDMVMASGMATGRRHQLRPPRGSGGVRGGGVNPLRKPM